jgi:hypothetical protein
MAVNPSSNIPVPDPTLITEREIEKARGELRNEFRSLIGGLSEIVKVQLDGRIQDTDANLRLVSEKLNVVGERFNRVDERFKSIDTLFQERSNQGKDDKVAVNTAITTAFAAADKAMAERNTSNAESMRKTEEGFKDRLGSLETKIDANRGNTDNGINDLKERMTRLETSALTARETKGEARLNIGSIVGVIGGVIGLLMLMMASFQLYSNHAPQPGLLASNPIVGVDTKRVDDLIAQSLAQSQALNSRLDALSARMTNSGKQP